MFVGMLLILMGMLFLLEQIGILTDPIWGYFWPLAIVALGVSFITDSKKKRRQRQ